MPTFANAYMYELFSGLYYRKSRLKTVECFSIFFFLIQLCSKLIACDMRVKAMLINSSFIFCYDFALYIIQTHALKIPKHVAFEP